MCMRSIAGIVIGGAFAFAGAAAAADLPVKAPPPVTAVANWTGCYVGISAGSNWGRTDGFVTTNNTVLPENGFPLRINPGVNDTGAFDLPGSIIAGGFGGCNYQFANRFVIGGEVDWSYANKSAWAKLVPNGIALMGGLGNVNDLWELTEHQIGTARVRLGYAVSNNWLVYATGGVAYAEVESYETITTNPTPPESWRQTNWRTGWTVGAGTEYAIGRGWSVRGEFLYVDLGRWTTFNIPPTGIAGSDTFSNMSVNLRDYILRLGLSYKFGPPLAVVAKY